MTEHSVIPEEGTEAMTELVKIRGLNRSSNVRINTGKLSPTTSVVIDLDDTKTRRDLSNHSAIGQYVVVGNAVAAVRSGVVVTNGTTTTWSISAGKLEVEPQDGIPGGEVTVGALSNQATTPDGSNPRIDLIVVDEITGVASRTAGTAAATPAQPATPAGKVLVATLAVAAAGTTPADVVITDRAPRLI